MKCKYMYGPGDAVKIRTDLAEAVAYRSFEGHEMVLPEMLEYAGTIQTLCLVDTDETAKLLHDKLSLWWPFGAFEPVFEPAIGNTSGQETNSGSISGAMTLRELLHARPEIANYRAAVTEIEALLRKIGFEKGGTVNNTLACFVFTQPVGHLQADYKVLCVLDEEKRILLEGEV